LKAVIPSTVEIPVINLADLMTPVQVKKKYMLVIARVHPDKIKQAGLGVRENMICKAIFEGLNGGWEAFKLENG